MIGFLYSNTLQLLRAFLDKIVRYGERGVVDTIVHSLVKNGQSKQFLELIKWGDGASIDWIKRVDSVTLLNFIIKLRIHTIKTTVLT